MEPVTGSSQLSKLINRSLILHQIKQHKAISRTELARVTGLTSGTVSNITGELLREGVIVTQGTTDSTGGRPQVLLAINTKSHHVLGVNIGGTKIIAVRTNLNGDILQRIDERFDARLPVDQQLQLIIDTIEAAIPDDKVRKKIIGVGVGIPGLLDSASGISKFSPNLGWLELPIKKILQDKLGLPVFIDNSVRLGALGEKWYGAGNLKKDVIALYVGTGVGAGIIINGDIFYGSQEAAGEIGHIVVADDGDLCGCGKRGCLEAMASGPAIVRHARRLINSGRESSLRELIDRGEELTGELVHQAAQAGDPVGVEVMERVGYYIGVGMSILINLFNPELLVFNGGVSNSWDVTGPVILKTVESRTMPGQAQAARIVQSRLGDAAGPLGASSLIIEKFFSNPSVLDL